MLSYWTPVNPPAQTLARKLIALYEQPDSGIRTTYLPLEFNSSLVAAPVILLYVLMQRQILGTFATSGIKGELLLWKLLFESPNYLHCMPRNTIIRLYLEGPRSILRKTFVPITQPDHGYQRVINCQPQPVLAPFVAPRTRWWFLITVV